MLDRGGDEPGRRADDTPKRQVVRFGGAAREDDLGRPRADQRGDVAARLLHGRAGPGPLAMRARRVAREAEEREHRLARTGTQRSTGVEVEIDPHRNDRRAGAAQPRRASAARRRSAPRRTL